MPIHKTSTPSFPPNSFLLRSALLSFSILFSVVLTFLTLINYFPIFILLISLILLHLFNFLSSPLLIPLPLPIPLSVGLFLKTSYCLMVISMFPTIPISISALSTIGMTTFFPDT